MTEPRVKFTELLWLELRREWKRFLIIEATLAVGFVAARSYFSSDAQPITDLSNLPIYAWTLLWGLVFGAAINLTFSFLSTWITYLEGILSSFETEMNGLRNSLTAELGKNFASVSDQLSPTTGLNNDALRTWSDYLRGADKLYSIVYVRPALWHKLGDLMNVFSLQAYYRHERNQGDKPLEMVRFLVWDEEQFLSSSAIFIIRASMLVGARTCIITPQKLKEVVRGHPVLQSFVENELHVWLECRKVDGIERPHAGRYGRVKDNRFEDPLSMTIRRPDAQDPKPGDTHSQYNFFELIKLLNFAAFELELDVDSVPQHVEEAYLRDTIEAALRGMRV